MDGASLFDSSPGEYSPGCPTYRLGTDYKCVGSRHLYNNSM